MEFLFFYLGYGDEKYVMASSLSAKSWCAVVGKNVAWNALKIKIIITNNHRLYLNIV
jgi:hypothetical protein